MTVLFKTPPTVLLWLTLYFAIPAAAEDRTIDGTNNNLTNPNFGAAQTKFIRLASANYDDGMASPTELGMTNARTVSNSICKQIKTKANDYSLSNFVWQWGQFIDHDLSHSGGSTSPSDAFPIMVDSPDPLAPFIPLQRTAADPATGLSTMNPREQINGITAFIDASMVYGSDSIRANTLRTLSGGQLKTSANDLLPFNTYGLPNANDTGLPPESLFLAGDVRANEQLGLTCLHTIFVREHNRQAAQLAINHPTWNDEQLYQRARKIIGAIIQSITYNEFLPAFIGDHAPDIESLTYNPTTNPSIANEFATALYRVGHTMVSEELVLIENDGSPAPNPSISIFNAFFSPQTLVNTPLLLPQIIKGLASSKQEDSDPQLIDDFRQQLLGAPGSGGMDLASLNIQRGRDHGLASYNDVRSALGLAPALSFSDITSDPATLSALQSTYSDLSKIDLWVGALAEDHAHGCAVGELIATSLHQQFNSLAEGDRFFFLFDPELADIKSELLATRLSDVIMRNTTLTNLQENVFFAPLDIESISLTINLDPQTGDIHLSTFVSPDKTYSLQRSLDLTDWQTIQSNLNAFGTLHITDSSVNPTTSRVYYRLIED